MKFAIFREIKKGKRKFLMEWNQSEIAAELEKELPGAAKALDKIIAKFKKGSLRIP
jgi:hypothetical protein